jgi:predicted dehydrogenase
MNNDNLFQETRNISRRNFVRASAAVPALTGLAGNAVGYLAGSDTIRVGMVGCGGRNTEAAGQALTADKGARLVAMADVAPDRVQERRTELKVKFGDQVQVDDQHCFSGFDGYKNVIESSDVVLIANAAKFHPMHMMAAIQAGKHVFVEKPHAIDPAGIKVVNAAVELARKKNVSVLSGLQSRFTPMYREAIQRVHDGAIGDIVSIEERYFRAPYVLRDRKPGHTEVQHQAANQYHFHWLCGDDIPQSLVHNLDRANWAMKGTPPVRCIGEGGRSTLHEAKYGNVFDHHSIIYEYANGVRIHAFCRTIPNCFNQTSSMLVGTKGRCYTMQGRIEGESKWEYAGPKMYSGVHTNPYQIEHDELFKAIRSGKPLNCGDYMAQSTLLGIMGQISCYSGQAVTWEQVTTSDFYFAPRPEDVRADMAPPTTPGPDGVYPVCYTPGVSKLL